MGNRASILYDCANVNDIERVFSEEQEALYELGEVLELTWLGQTVEARFQALDMGEIPQLFDDDLGTFVRSAAANPLLLQFTFTEPVTVSAVDVHIGGAPTNIDRPGL